MLILGGNPIGNCLGRRWLAFLGRPSGRTVCSDPRSFTVSRTHVSSPYGRPRSMLTRTRVRLNHDALERLEVGLLAEHMHPADGSVQDVIDKAPGATLAVVGMSTSATRTEDFRQYQSRPGFRPPARGEKARMRVLPRCLQPWPKLGSPSALHHLFAGLPASPLLWHSIIAYTMCCLPEQATHARRISFKAPDDAVKGQSRSAFQEVGASCDCQCPLRRAGNEFINCC
jgi:hypothetical protein